MAFNPEIVNGPVAQAAPYWGPIDSNMDWCEPNYISSIYAAEVWNTLSSIPISLFGVFGVITSLRFGLTDLRYKLAFFALFTVGLGSTLFHMTLRRYAQSFDELPMMYGAFILLYNAIDLSSSPSVSRYVMSDGVQNHPFNGVNSHKEHSSRDRVVRWRSYESVVRSYRDRWVLKSILLSIALLCTLIYLCFPDYFILFFLGYGGGVLSLTAVTTYNLYFNPMFARFRFRPRNHNHVDANLSMTGNPKGMRNSLPLDFFHAALLFYGCGTLIWVIENLFCESLPSFLRLHAAWHILAGLGTYFQIQCQMALRALVHQLQVGLSASFCIPFITIKIQK